MTGLHETRDTNIRRLVGFGLGLSVLVAVAMIAMWLLFRYLAGQGVAGAGPSSMVGAEGSFPQPRLQVTPATELEAKRSSEDLVLNGYRWVDRDAGVVGIPIERAMDLLAARGLGHRTGKENKR